MKLNYLVPSVLTAGSVAIAFSVTLPANAFSFTTPTDAGNCLTNAQAGTFNTCTTGDGFTLKSSSDVITGNSGNLGKKTVSGITGIGVRGGPANNEIGLRNNENILLTLPTGKSLLTSLGLAFLYQPGVFNDKVFEIAGVDSTSLIKGTLTITGNTTANWKWTTNGTNFTTTPITAVSGEGSNQGQGGYYVINNPFGTNTSILSTTLFAVSNGAGDGSGNSDFALVSATAAPSPNNQDPEPIPEPESFNLFGVVAALGFAAFYKRNPFKRKQRTTSGNIANDA